ncbi:MAG: hypothetical protein ACOC3A_06285, partial [Thermodesulfobacteriota bacterium]
MGYKPDIKEYKTRLRKTMWKNAGIVRNEQELKQALKVINELKLDFNQIYKCRNLEEYEFRNL